MLDLNKLNALVRLTAERVKRDHLEDDKLLIDIGEIVTEAVRQHAAEVGRLTAERDAAKHDINLVMKGACVCHICSDGNCANSPDCEPNWRGAAWQGRSE